MQTTSTRPTHIVFAAFPAFGHVRPVLALASSLIPLGYTVTLITGTSFRARVEAIQGVEFVPLRGKADFDFDVPFAERFPDRPSGGSATLPFDMEHVFHDGFGEQFVAVKEVIERPDLKDRPTVIVAAAAFVGTMPMSLRSPSIRHVPLIGLGHFPLGVLSKDTAPIGMGLPSQGVEANRQLNQDAIAMFSSVAACERRLLEPYHCTKALPSPYHFDNWVLLCDVYFQLSVPALELHRSDLPANVRFCGALEGHNAAGTNTTTTALLPPWFNDFVLPPSPSSSTEASHPLILVTSGTLPGQSAHDLILPTITACASLAVRLVVCAVHVPFDPSLPLPPNVRWAQWIPFEAILPYTSLVVSSGGYGSITQAFAHGVPIICAGVTEEKPHTSMLAAASGAGINLKTQTPDVEQVQSAVLEMLRDPGFEPPGERQAVVAREGPRLSGCGCRGVDGHAERHNQDWYRHSDGACGAAGRHGKNLDERVWGCGSEDLLLHVLDGEAVGDQHDESQRAVKKYGRNHHAWGGQGRVLHFFSHVHGAVDSLSITINTCSDQCGIVWNYDERRRGCRLAHNASRPDRCPAAEIVELAKDF